MSAMSLFRGRLGIVAEMSLAPVLQGTAQQGDN